MIVEQETAARRVGYLADSVAGEVSNGAAGQVAEYVGPGGRGALRVCSARVTGAANVWICGLAEHNGARQSAGEQAGFLAGGRQPSLVGKARSGRHRHDQRGW